MEFRPLESPSAISFDAFAPDTLAFPERSQRISHLPGINDKFLRYYTTAECSPIADIEEDFETSAQALEIIHKRTRHLGFLATQGIRIPSHQAFIAKAPALYAYSDSQLAIYDVVERIIPFKGPSESEPTLSRNSHKTIYTALYAYTEWLKDNNERAFMFDIFRPGQYTEDMFEMPTLLDIDPRFILTTKHSSHSPYDILNDFRIEAEKSLAQYSSQTQRYKI